MAGAPGNTQQISRTVEEVPPWPHHLGRMSEEADERLELPPLTRLSARPTCQSGEDAVQLVCRQAQATCLCVYLEAEECDPGCRALELVHIQRHAQLEACVEYDVQILGARARPRRAQWNKSSREWSTVDMPCLHTIHSSASATVLNISWAECSPKRGHPPGGPCCVVQAPGVAGPWCSNQRLRLNAILLRRHSQIT